jgi:hypothetical protein
MNRLSDLDRCGGVRTDGRPDPWTPEAFFKAVNG